MILLLLMAITPPRANVYKQHTGMSGPEDFPGRA